MQPVTLRHVFLALFVSLITPGWLNAGVVQEPECPTCADETPPEIALISPASPTSLEFPLIKIHWCDLASPLNATSRLIRVNGINRTSSFNYTTTGGVECSENEAYSQTTTVSLSPGDNTIYASICDAAGNCGNETFIVNRLPRGVAIRAELSERQHFAATGGSQPFFVKNLQTTLRTYTISAVCVGSPSGCAVTPTSAALNPGESKVVTLTYTVGTGGTTGTAWVRAVDNGSPSVKDSAAVAVKAIAPPLPVVSIVDVNPGTTIGRDGCLTIAAGSASAFECGDLRIVHALPAIRTVNKTRVPTLLYNSAFADPYPIVAATVTLPSGPPVPDSIQAVLKVGGIEKARGRWAGGDWTPGGTRRIALGYSAAGDTTTVYDYTLEVAAPSDSLNATVVTGKLVIVNRRGGGFGAGWWLAGLERLTTLSDSSRLWIGGDGSARVYAPVGADAWAAANLDRPDTLKRVGTAYVRRLPGGVSVWFNAAGQHDSTVNRLGHRTSFAYTSGRLVSITLPSQGGGQTYTFAYDGNDQLTSVTAPGARVTAVRVSALRVDSIRDPDNTTVRFTYENPSSRRIETRTDRRGTVTSYSYDAAKKLWRAHVALPSDSIRVGFRALDVQGLATAMPKTATDTANVYTSFLGARQFTTGANFILQETKFWVDRHGAPRRIVNQLGHQTLTKREDGEWPALATEVVAANGFTTRAGYDGRGNIVRSVAVNPLGNGQDALTRYHWDAKWDFADSLIAPTGVVTTMAYDANSGNRLWQQVGSDVARRVTFRYGNDTLKLLTSTVLPLTPADSVEYDDQGNVAATRTPRGFWMSFYKDALGRDTLTVSPIDSADLSRGGSNANRQQVRVLYDVADRDTLSQTITPAMSGAPQQTLTVRQAYDPEGNRLSLTRQSSAPDAGIGPITTQWRYDPAGRRRAEVAPDGEVDSTRYDPAGNVVEILTRRDSVIRMEYDALDRLTKRRVPAMVYAPRMQGIPARGSPVTQGPNPAYPLYPNDPSGGYTIPADSATFSYDTFGNITRADNGDAWVRRGYHPSGQLRADTLRIRTVVGVDSTTHQYVLEPRYDLGGRRVGLKHPANLAPVVGGQVRDSAGYAYDPQTGELIGVTDPLGNQLHLHYNHRGELDSLSLPGGIAEVLSYAADGSLAGHRVRNGSGSAYRHPDPDLRLATFARDGRGQFLWTGSALGTRDTATAAYSGPGHVTWGAMISHGWNVFPNGPTRSKTTESPRYDALANIVSTTTTRLVERPSTTESSTRIQTYTYAPGTGRLARTENVNIQHDTMYYDAAGNVEFMTQSAILVESEADYEDRASYYAADGTLRAADFRVVPEPNVDLSPYYSTFEEYRYDALGRRVWVRARRWCERDSFAAECRIDKVRRTVWDGAQELYEIQMPGDNMSPYLENDTQQVVLPSTSEGASYRVDPNPYFGRVAYTYALGLDRPMSVVRMGYGDLIDENSIERPHRTLAPFAIFPIWAAERSDVFVGVFEDGGLRKCETVGGVTRCVYLGWPETWPAYKRSALRRTFWHGTLIEDKRDETGTYFRRNRYYDPGTGRFTQEDPIGLAGGLNLYGFAGGDPVNFSDPFGLCPCLPFVDPKVVFDGLSQAAFEALPYEQKRAYVLSMAQRNADWPIFAASLLTGGGPQRLLSRIGRHPGLTREASSLSGQLQRSVDHLTSELARGNLNPGIGTKHLFGSIFYARSRDGARVFFRQTDEGIEVLAKATKQNEARVIRMLEETYK